ncbi:MAG: hypothetical protein M9925_09570 [Chloroflexi bacterium]|nr:hypothetical protein [Chloroflexota bacterium]
MVFLGISNLAGLPAHPLLVHAAVVLVPLAAIALAVTCWRTSWRKAYSLPVALLAMAGAAAAFLAKESGEPLEDAVKRAAQSEGVRARFGDHPEQGDTAFVFAVLLAIAAIGVWAVDRYGSRFNLPKWAPMATYGVALVPAALALITMIVAGHSGAQLVWKDVGSFAAGR